jgi:hypothetical protein
LGEKKSAIWVLVGTSGGRKLLGRRRRRWENNNKMDLREVSWEDTDWIDLAQDMKS